MTFELNLKPDTYIDFAFGKVIQGKEMQVFTQYFPLITKALEECQIQSLHSFAVLATNSSGPTPEQGALTQVPSPEKFAQFHQDPRFIEAKPLRDEAMTFLNDGNFFSSIDKQLTLQVEVDYALIISNEDHSDGFLSLNAASNSPKQVYANKALSLTLWNDKAEAMLAGPESDACVFKVRFFPEQS